MKTPKSEDRLAVARSPFRTATTLLAYAKTWLSKSDDHATRNHGAYDHVMNATVRYGVFVVCFIGVFAGTVVLANAVSGRSEPLWRSVVPGVIGAVGVAGAVYMKRRGWLRGVVWDRVERDARLQKCAQDRERIIADAHRRT